MVVLTEQIEIPASYEKMEAWTANFEEEFVKWSPYHIECNLYNGNYHAGSKVRFREIVMGLDYDVTGTITECEQDENHFRIVSSLDHAIQGNTLTDPFHRSDDGKTLRQFDYVVCNPPFNLDFSGTRETLAAMPARFWAGIPNVPKKKKESISIYTCFLQHV